MDNEQAIEYALDIEYNRCSSANEKQSLYIFLYNYTSNRQKDNLKPCILEHILNIALSK